MNLCVYGSEDLDVLQRWVDDKFSSIINKKMFRSNIWTYSPQTDEQLGTQFFVVPIKDLRSVTIVWNFPPLKTKYQKKQMVTSLIY